MDRDLRSRRVPAHGKSARSGDIGRRYDLPRTTMRGGDPLRGGNPVGPGHAGKARLSWTRGVASTTRTACVPSQGGGDRRVRATRAVPMMSAGNRINGAVKQAQDVGRTLLAVMLAIILQVAALLSCSATTAFAATGVVTEMRSTGTGDGVFPGHAYAVDDRVAYCASSYLGNPAVGDVLERYDGAIGIPALDYVLYHGYDGVTVTSLSGLSADDSRLATQLAVWEAIGYERPDILSWPNHQGDGGQYHGNYNYETRMPWARVSHPDIAAAADKLIKEANAYATAGGGGEEAGFATLYLNTGRMTDDVWYQHFVVVGEKAGQLELTKVSADEELTAGDDRYSLAGAVYGIYSDEACTSEVGRMTTDANGHALSENLVAGTYWVREVTAPKGYALDIHAYRATVVAGSVSKVNEGQVRDVPESGTIGLTKVSAEQGLTAGNGCYSLAGAVYGIYSDEACTSEVGRMTTDANGYALSGRLAPGSYWVREVTAPKGYLSDETAYEVTVSAGATAQVNGGQVVDQPAAESNLALVRKLDADGDQISADLAQSGQGNATLAGAEFTVRYYDVFAESTQSLPAARRTWTFAADETGLVTFDEDHLVRGDALFTSADGQCVLPLGTYAVQESKAPEGYLLSDTAVRLAQVVQGDDGLAHWRTLDGWSGTFAEEELAGRALRDFVRRGGLSIQKVDAQAGDAQGDATLAGIAFEVVNESEHTVIVGGVPYASGEVIEPLTLVTDEQGKASTGADALPMGTYRVRERSSNESYLLASHEQVVTIAEEDLGGVRALGESFADEVARGGVVVGKHDRELGLSQAQGAATLEGAVIAIELASDQPVIVGDETFAPGTVVMTIETDADGIAQTGERDLPYGTYVLYEAKASEGYLLTPRSEWCPTVQIREDGVMVDLTSAEASLPESVARGDLAGVKVREADMARLAGVPFVIESLTTGERHVVVTDENGEFSTEASWVSHEAGTNANDEVVLLADDDTYALVDGAELSMDAGVWFGGSADDLSCAADDSRGALPYDRYRVTEVACPANDGLALACFEVQVPTRVSRDGRTVNLGTIDDRPGPAIETQLAYEGGGSAPALENTQLVDVVSYSSLQPGAFYELSGSLHLVDEDGTDLGIIATSGTELVPEAADGHAEVCFELDAHELAGYSVVAFEVLTQGDVVVATHEDLNDEGQTVTFPLVGTTLADGEGSHEVLADARVVLVDTVAYEGLVPGTSYEMVGTLMDRETGEAALDDTGAAICARTTFVPDAPSGEVELAFTFAGTSLAGHDVVAFERLLEGTTVVAAHEDLDDDGQTVTFPSVGTDLADDEGRHVTLADEEVRLVDTVRYENLTPGVEYVVSGILMDRATGEPLVIGDVTVEAEGSFVPEGPDGMTTVEFSFDASGLAGRSVVAFETLTCDGHVVARHEDLQDERQTVTFPSIGTKASISEEGQREAVAEGTVRIIDTISYQGLVPGVEYVARGTVHVVGSEGEDAGALRDEEGREIEASASFVPEASDGTVQVEFEIDASRLGDRTLVVFEQLYQGERLIAVHADISSEPQTVRLAKPEEPTPEVPDEPEKPDEPTPEKPETPATPKAPEPQKPAKGRELPQTGVGTAAVALVLIGCLTVLAGAIVSARRPKAEHVTASSRHSERPSGRHG